MHELIIRQRDLAPQTVRLDRVRMTIGRSSRNDICISDPFASRLHAEFRLEGDQAFLMDIGSANGTFLNGHKIVGLTRLSHGDLIRIGETEIEFRAAPMNAPTVYLSGPESSLPPDSITTSLSHRTTSELLESLQGARPASAAAAQPVGRRDLLSIVSRVGIALLPRTSLEETLRMTIDLVFDAIPAERGFLLLKEGDELRCRIARGAQGEIASQIQLSRSITSKVLNEGASILTSDAMNDPRFQSHQSVVLSQVRSVMAVPLANGEEVFGMIYVDNPLDNRFTEDDLNVLTTIASVASIKIEHAKLLEERLEKRRMEEELKVASEIQMRLQPIRPPSFPGWDLTGVSFPCSEIGGDYYDFIHRKKDDRLIIGFGDVSGKGIGAALLMSSLHAAVRAQSQTCLPICEVVAQINQYIYENSPPNKFLTLFYGELDPQSATLRYSNAGHNPPILVRRSGQILRLDVGGLPIGMFENSPYKEGSVEFEPGDVLVIYSDGISEAVNDAGEEFGEERIIQTVQDNIDRSASRLRDRIDEAVSRFLGRSSPADDMTLVIVKREAQR